MKQRFIHAAIAALVLGAAPAAYAVPTISVSLDGGPAIVCTDGAGCDGSAAAGVVRFDYSSAEFVVNVTTGISKPVLTTGNPAVHLDTVNVQVLGGAHTLAIMFSDTDFILKGQFTADYAASLSGPGGSISYAAYYDAGNDPFALASQIGAVGPFGPGVPAGTFGVGLAPDSPYSLTQVLTLSTAGAITTFSGNFEINVPEPTTLALLGLGLVGFAATRRRRQTS